MTSNILATHENLFSLHRIEQWVDINIQKPIKGFEHKQNSDGSFYSLAQQMKATRLQVMAVARYFMQKGKSIDEVRGVLAHFQ